MLRSFLALEVLLPSALAGSVLWDGRFNDLASSADLTKWSFDSKVGPYQWYIHGDSDVKTYVDLEATYKNPADTSAKQGAKLTIDKTSYWHGQTMRRTELIPQTAAAINKGHVVYHFSMKRADVNAPSTALEHQVCFFESHFTEMKYGLISGEQGTSDTNLRWEVGMQSQWNTTWAADVWHNIAYDIDFDKQTVGFWHSTGSDELKQVVEPKAASASSDGADWHLGVLRLPASSGGSSSDDGPEDWYFSGVYVESAPVTTSVSGPAGTASTAGGSSAGSSGNATAPASSGSGSGGTSANSGGAGGSGSGTSGSGSSGTGVGASGGSSSSSSTTSASSPSTTSLPTTTYATPPPSPPNMNATTGSSGSGSSGSGSGGSSGASGSTGTGTGSSSSTGGSSSGGTGSALSKLTSKDQAIQITQLILDWIQNPGGQHARDLSALLEFE